MYLFIASVSTLISQKCHNADRQARLYPGTRGLPELGYHPFYIIKIFLLFSFFSNVWMPLHAKDY
jgi:hypothetical protein